MKEALARKKEVFYFAKLIANLQILKLQSNQTPPKLSLIEKKCITWQYLIYNIIRIFRYDSTSQYSNNFPTNIQQLHTMFVWLTQK